MISPSSLLGRLALVVVFAFGTAGMAQNRQLSPPRPGGVQPGFGMPQADKPATLTSNYRLVFSGKAGDKSLGELSMLTCSPDVQLGGPLDNSQEPATFGVTGTLEEKEGQIYFVYSISFSLPVTTAVTSGPVGPGSGPQPSMRNIQYQQHTASGTLRMKPGKIYDVLKAGGATYTISIAAEEEK